jgi:hypothetical protein
MLPEVNGSRRSLDGREPLLEIGIGNRECYEPRGDDLVCDLGEEDWEDDWVTAATEAWLMK